MFDACGRIRNLNLSGADRDAIVAFLGAFTDPRVVAGLSPFDRPTLYSETNQGAQHYGHGTAGSGNITPLLVAIEPPHLGHATFALGLDRSLGGAPALLILDGTANLAGQRLFGADVFVSLSAAAILLPVTTAGSGAGNGTASQVLPIPDVAALRRVQLYAQWFVVDQGVGGLAATDAVRLPIL